MSESSSASSCCNVPAQAGENAVAAKAERERWLRPRYEVTRGDHAVDVRVLVPGATKQSVNVNVEDGVLTVRADRTDSVGEGWRPMQRELDRAGYLLKLELKADFDTTAIKARVENGILQLTVPFAEKAKARSIAVS